MNIIDGEIYKCIRVTTFLFWDKLFRHWNMNRWVMLTGLTKIKWLTKRASESSKNPPPSSLVFAFGVFTVFSADGHSSWLWSFVVVRAVIRTCSRRLKYYCIRVEFLKYVLFRTLCYAILFNPKKLIIY